jgi:hypothetical protein
MSLGEWSLGEWSLGEMSLGETSLGETSLGEPTLSQCDVLALVAWRCRHHNPSGEEQPGSNFF